VLIREKRHVRRHLPSEQPIVSLENAKNSDGRRIFSDAKKRLDDALRAN
jgi:hypothetical protein